VATISHYRLEAEIGRGGMGVVHRAVDTKLGRQVAIKVLPAHATSDPERRRRFIQEARAASALNHPHIVTIYEVDEHEGTIFIVMEFVDGTPLDRLLAGGPVPVVKALEYGAQIASALEAAHAAGIVHRDIKPGNIVVTRDGRVKVLDFGLAKLIERAPTEETISNPATMMGMVLGTAAYMSPEQAQGLRVDARSDLFSFGGVLYEMLTGRRPFAASSDVGLIAAILRDDPPSVSTLRPEVPASIDAIVRRAQVKRPEDRYQSAAAMRADLESAFARLTRSPEAIWRRPALFVPLVLVLVAIAAFGVWQTVQVRRARWVRREAVPEIERQYNTGRTMDAVRLARQADRYAPDEIARVRAGWTPFTLVTEPTGARIEMKNYADTTGPWEEVGVTPLPEVRLPFGYYRVRITKPGYKTLEVSALLVRGPVKLTPESDAAPGMVFVPGGPYRAGGAPPVTLPDYWIDQLEVTNALFKSFVDAGGYHDPKYWKQPFRDGERLLSFDEAMARFRDSTGRTGPSTWELGTYPEGRADYPVSGISWFEAAAYAEFAGKSLPSVYHWYRASGTNEIYSDILQLSNFDGKGPTKAGERGGLGPWGTLDMAGNVKEWCANEVTAQERRYILGGGWDEPSYRFAEEDARNPWLRLETFGVRLVKNLGPSRDAAAPVGRVLPDPRSVVPVSDEKFEIYRHLYDYDRTPLDARVDSVDDSSPYWRKETVSFAAAYGRERIPAYLFLPKHVSPPYQTVVLFPSGYAQVVRSSRNLDLISFEFIVRSGRALFYPVYQGTFERGSEGPIGRSTERDVDIQRAKDFFRSVDYLESRKEIDMQRLGYYSVSMGAFFGPIPIALEPRVRATVFASAGLRYDTPPETQPSNFSPRVKIPVLVVNGKDDFGVPVAEQERFFELLGTPPDQKRHVLLEGGHVPHDRRALMREVLDWYDKYLGPVK
jgi:formylglycine-generating enzyme required for sulfatase activity/dienelactone hydrolase/predicted Ser/Thr protein kinase